MNIYTHNGKAHSDELYAVAIIKATHDGPFKVHRVATVPELEQDDFVVDIGMKYDGERLFDHHQFDTRMMKHSAATLVADRFAKSLLLHRDWSEVLNRVAAVDIGGPSAMDISMEQAKPYIKLEWALVSMFERDPDTASDMLASIIRSELEEIDRFNQEVVKAKEWIEKYSAIHGIKTIRALEVTRDPAEDGLSDAAVQAAQSHYLEQHEISVVYSWDPRDPERKLRRLFQTQYGSGKVDFRRSNWENKYFCHTTGFLFTFHPTHSREWVEIVSKSII